MLYFEAIFILRFIYFNHLYYLTELVDLLEWDFLILNSYTFSLTISFCVFRLYSLLMIYDS